MPNATEVSKPELSGWIFGCQGMDRCPVCGCTKVEARHGRDDLILFTQLVCEKCQAVGPAAYY